VNAGTSALIHLPKKLQKVSNLEERFCLLKYSKKPLRIRFLAAPPPLKFRYRLIFHTFSPLIMYFIILSEF